MFKFLILVSILILPKIAMATEYAFTINQVKIKIPPACVIENAERLILTCKINSAGSESYLGFHENKDFHKNIINNNRKKSVQKIGDDYFVQFIIGNHPFNLLSLQKCDIAIAGSDANLLFSVMTDIKIDNEICR
nr:hypothetical protein [Comamonas koreensis]